MTTFDRRTFLLSAAAATTTGSGALAAGNWKNALSAYHVRDPLAGYFDLSQRRAIMRSTVNPTLLGLRKRMLRPPSCAEVMAIPVQDQDIRLPAYYEDNAKWRKAVAPFSAFEDAVSQLAAANLIASNRRFAECLVDLLLKWARRNALAKFNYTPDIRQGWFQVESTLFAVGLALAAIRPDVLHRKAELAEIDAWLSRVATSHYAIEGLPGGTCCNNHYYRRSVYATIIGVLTRDDRLFRSGLGAVYSALSGATPEGALPLEMKRGPLAAHYQNYGVMYLSMIAEIAERQGYPFWSLEIDGKTLHSLVALNNKIIADPNFVLKYSGAKEVSLRYRKDNQYFAWFEIYLSRFRNPEMEAWIAGRRPLYNRSLGGYLTAYFYGGR